MENKMVFNLTCPICKEPLTVNYHNNYYCSSCIDFVQTNIIFFSKDWRYRENKQHYDYYIVDFYQGFAFCYYDVVIISGNISISIDLIDEPQKYLNHCYNIVKEYKSLEIFK